MTEKINKPQKRNSPQKLLEIAHENKSKISADIGPYLMVRQPPLKFNKSPNKFLAKKSYRKHFS